MAFSMRIEGYEHRRISQAEYIEFYSIDRKLYATLVYDIWRDPVEAIQMMAIWIFLERVVTMGFSKLTRRILALPYQWINKIGDEALLCWACIDNIGPLFYSPVIHFPLTTIVLQTEMPIEVLRRFREISISGINEVIDLVCTNSLKDIWYGAIARNAHRNLIQRNTSLEHVAPRAKIEIKRADRTLFITFSRGYPVAEREVRDFFTRIFGECIESFYMQEVAIGEHALFAKIVLNHISYVHVVLGRGTKSKFIINGKHVWMRKFIPRYQRS